MLPPKRGSLEGSRIELLNSLPQRTTDNIIRGESTDPPIQSSTFEYSGQVNMK